MDKSRLKSAYQYFSHHIRTSTATIVAILETLKEGLITEEDETKEMISLVEESGFFLDLFDCGMDISFCYLTDDAMPPADGSVDAGTITKNFLDRIPVMLLERGVTITVDEHTKVTLHGNMHVIKTLITILFFEAVRTGSGEMTVTIGNNSVTVTSPTDFIEVPQQILLFQEMLAVYGIALSSEARSISMRVTV